jgi:hypothetical protein
MSPTTPVTREEILKAFATVLETRAPLNLHNVFRGVPINYPAQVTSIGQDTVALKVHCLQSVVISLEKRTFIESDALPVILRAFPKTVNFNNQEVILTNFSPAGKAFIERTHLRVQPKEPVNVSILSGDGAITGTMADISLSGAGVFVFGAYISGQFSVDLAGVTRVGLDLSLPGSDQSIHLIGTISSMTREKGMKMSRIGIKISPEPVFETALMKYIDQRQVEILDELQKIYQRTCPSRQD